MRYSSRNPKSKSNGGISRFHCSPWAFAFAFLAVVLTQGCQSYDIVSRNVFINDNAERIVVDYGRSEKDHVNTFISPATGKEMDFKSKLMIVLTFPDGYSVKAWQCMNFLPQGTMYETDDGEWKVLVNGFSCFLYLRTPENPPRYEEIFRGILCDSPEVGSSKKNDKWRDVTHHDKREYKRPAPIKTK